MTEHEWLVSDDPDAMLTHLRTSGPEVRSGVLFGRPLVHQTPHPAATGRKLRLFACACALGEVNSTLLGRRSLHEEAQLAEKVADGDPMPRAWWSWVLSPLATDAALSAAASENSNTRDKAHLLRDIFGNPFQPVKFDSAWRSPTAARIAQSAYENRDWDALPILADALEDAGCPAEVPCPLHPSASFWPADICQHCHGRLVLTNPILEHLRGPGPHVRGCWALDLVLGKE